MHTPRWARKLRNVLFSLSIKLQAVLTLASFAFAIYAIHRGYTPIIAVYNSALADPLSDDTVSPAATTHIRAEGLTWSIIGITAIISTALCCVLLAHSWRATRRQHLPPNTTNPAPGRYRTTHLSPPPSTPD